MAGCSISWFNTLCYVLCIQYFPGSRPLALSLTTGFNGVSAALYTLIANAINPHNDSLYLSLNALVPVFISILAVVPILRQPPPPPPPPPPPLHNHSTNTIPSDSLVFLLFNGVAVFTGLYLILLDSLSYNTYNISVARILLGGAVLLLFLPLSLPAIIYPQGWVCQTTQSSSTMGEVEFHELQKQLIGSRPADKNSNPNSMNDFSLNMDNSNGSAHSIPEKHGSSEVVTGKDQLIRLGEEYPAWTLIQQQDFWLYYIAYLCGGTIGLAYSNNLGQISESLGYSSETNTIVTLYSACSFFGRLLSAAPDFLGK